VKSKEETTYRLRLAKGYIEEAEKLFDAKLWRACAGSCQLAVENACKAIISLFRPVVKTHEVSRLLLELSAEEKFTGKELQDIEKLADYARILGLKEHILMHYGDELTYKVPWEIYKEEHAKRAMEIAVDAVRIAEEFARLK